jgi:thioredoxin reductase
VERYEIIIVGAGPAGIACAMQLKRFGMDPLIIEKSTPGGLLHEASLIENYPGFAEGIKSEDLIRQLTDHLKKYHVRVLGDEVTRIEWDGRDFHVKTSTDRFSSDKLVIASGTLPIKPDIISGDTTNSNKILYGIRSIKGVSGLDIAIIGAGDAAFDYALSLSRKNRVTIFNRGMVIKALPLLRQRVENNKKIIYNSDYKLLDIRSDTLKDRLICRFNVENSTSAHICDYLIFATGRKPALDFMSPTLEATRQKLQEAGRLFLIGDVRGDRFRQTSIAAGEGIRAAMKIADESHQ